MTSAHLTTGAEAQDFEDGLAKLARTGDLYRMRLQIERDLLIGRSPGTAISGREREPGEHEV